MMAFEGSDCDNGVYNLTNFHCDGQLDFLKRVEEDPYHCQMAKKNNEISIEIDTTYHR